MTHIRVSKLTIIASDNGMSPGRCQAIIWTNAGILLFGPLGTNFSEIFIKIYTFSFKKMHSIMSSAKWRPFCLGLNVLTWVMLKWSYQVNFIHTCWCPVSIQYQGIQGDHFTKDKIWDHNWNLVKLNSILSNFPSNDLIMSQFCTYYDSWAVMVCAKLWHDLIAIVNVRTTCIF